MTSGISHPIGNLEAAPVENGEVPANPRFWCTGRTWRPDHQLLAHDRLDANVLDKVRFSPATLQRLSVQHGALVTQHDLKRHNALLAPVDQEDRRLDAREVRRAHAGLCRDTHFHLGDAVDQV